MTKYTIEQTETGIELGTYEAETAEAAWTLCCEDAGYSEPQEMDAGIEITGLDVEMVA